MSLRNCSTSFDCLEEINGELIQKFCFREVFNSDKNNFCGCDPLVGISGDACQQHSLQSIYFIFSKIILVCFSFGGVFYSFFLFNLLRNVVRVNSNADFNVLRSYSLAILFSCLSFLFEIIDNVADLKSVFSPEEFELILIPNPEEDVELVVNGLGIESIIANMCSIYFFGMACATIMLSWFNVILAAKIILGRSSLKKVLRFRFFVIATLTLFTLIGIIFIINGSVGIMVFIGSAISIIVLLLTFVARRLLVSVLRKMSDQTTNKVSLIRKVQHFSFTLLLGCFFFCCFFLYSALFYRNTLQYKPGDFNWHVNIYNLIFYVKTGLLYNILYYVHGLLGRLLEQGRFKKLLAS